MMTPAPDRFRPKQAAQYLHLSVSTLAKWRMRSYGPPYHHCGQRIVYYVRCEIDTWLATCDAVAADDR